MKKAGFLILILFSIQSKAQYIKTLYDQEKINGRVNSITETQLTLNSDGTATDSIVIKTQYDNRGNIVQEIYSAIYYGLPNIDVFDKDGNKITKRRRQNVSIFKYATYYQTNGKKITCNAYAVKNVYLFDKSGTLTRSQKYQTDGKLVNNDLYKYDDKNRLIEIDSYTEKDSLSEQIYINTTTKIWLLKEAYSGMKITSKDTCSKHNTSIII